MDLQYGRITIVQHVILRILRRNIVITVRESRDPIYSSNNSSNMREHIEGIYNIEVKLATSNIQQVVLEQLKELYRQVEATGEMSEINTQVLRKHLNQDVINEALISLIVVRNLAFASVEWPKLHTLCQVLNRESKDFITTAHSHIATKTKQLYEQHKDTIRKKLQSALTKIHFLVDI